MIDTVTQRRAAVWTFIGLVGVWLSQIAYHFLDVFNILESGQDSMFTRDFVLLLQWVAIFDAFFITLYLLQIPMLRFKLSMLIVLLVVSATLQMLIFFPSSPISVRQVTTRVYANSLEQRELNDVVVLSQINEDSDINADDYRGGIVGSFNVKVIPYSLADLNPNNDAQCIRLPICNDKSGFFSSGRLQEVSVEVAVLLSGIPPWKLKYGFRDFFSQVENNYTITVEYTNVDDNIPDDYSEESKHKWHMLNVENPGSLRLYELSDDQGPGVVSTNHVDINVCPEAFWKRDIDNLISSEACIKENSQGFHVNTCEGEIVGYSVLVYGVPPLSLDYIVQNINKKKSKDLFTVQRIENEDRCKPDLGIPLLGSAQCFVISLSNNTLEFAGTDIFRIESVVDGNGIKHNYDSNGDSISVSVNSSPRASFLCDSEIFRVADANGSLKDDLELLVNLEGVAPFNLEYSFLESASGTEVVHKKELIQSKKYAINIKHFGTLRLKRVDDANCKGEVLSSNYCKISRMMPPTIKIDFDVIESPCVGKIGFSASLKLSGTGPWTLWYELASENGDKRKHSIIVKQAAEKVEIKPPSSGKYTIQFTEFRDSRYPHVQEIKNVFSTQSFHMPASVVVQKYKSIVCIGESSEINVRFSGIKPWNVTYALVSRHERQVYSTVSESESATIRTHPLNSGRYYLEFLKLKDSSGCETTPKNQPLVIDALQSQSSINFLSLADEPLESKRNIYLIKEGGSVGLIVDIVGSNPPWKALVEYRFSNNDDWSVADEANFKEKNDVFVAKKPGHYRLRNFRDSVCPGKVLEPSSMFVQPIAIPEASIVSINDVGFDQVRVSRDKLYVCQGSQKLKMKLKFSGSPPYTWVYRVAKKNCEKNDHACEYSNFIRNEVRINQNYATVELESDGFGTYKYEPLWISDHNYERVQLDSESNMFEYDVRRSADVWFSDQTTRKICMGQNLLDSKLPLVVVKAGKLPLKVTYHVIIESTMKSDVKSFDLVLNQSKEEFHPKINFSNTGTYYFRLSKAIDSYNCDQTYSKTDLERSFKVQVYKKPELVSLVSGVDGCVGSKIGFIVRGIPPWVIKYSWTPLSSDQPQHNEIVVKMEDEGGWITSSAYFAHILMNNKIDKEEGFLSQDDNVKSRKVFIKFDYPGKFVVNEICHGEEIDSCCISIKPWEYEIHQLPFASVRESDSNQAVIRQGDVARMHINFKGSPPFSFNYKRLSDSNEELDSHVVTNIYELDYFLNLTQAGKFMITSIADKYCSYPPSSV